MYLQINACSITQLKALSNLNRVIQTVGLPDIHADKSPIGVAVITESISKSRINNILLIPKKSYNIIINCFKEKNLFDIHKWTFKGDASILNIKKIASTQKNKFMIPLPTVTSESIFLGVLLTIVGGFLDAYTYIGRGGVFANAQTANMVLVGIDAFEGNWGQVLLYCLPIFAFIVGVIVSEILKKSSSSLFISNSKGAILAIEIVILLIVGFVPYTVSNIFVTVTLSFITSLQYCSFKKLADSPYASTMCTGNLRSASQAAYTAFTKKDHKAAKEALSLFIIIFSFIFGAFLGGFLTVSTGAHAAWFADIFLIISLILLYLN